MKSGPPGFSSRTGWPAHPNPISRLLEEKRRQQTAVLDLTESNPTRCHFRFYDKIDLAALSDPRNLSYDPDPMGLPEASRAICGYYIEKNIKIVPEQVLLASGTSEAYSFLFRLLADPEDEVLAAEPSYPLFETLADLHDIRLKKFPSIYRGGWQLDLNALEKSFTERTKALLLVHPNNPTGHFISAREREALNALCVRRNCALIVDEVFLDYAWGPEGKADSFAGQDQALTFTLSGISKVLGLPQMKLSWIVVSGPKELRAEALRRLEIIADAHLSVSTPVQRALPVWMGARQAVSEEVNERVRDNFAYLKESLRAAPGFELLETEGGWYAALRGPEAMNDEAFVLGLLKNRDTLVHPGYFFDFPEENFLVLSLLPDKAVFREGVGRLLQAIGEA